MQQREIAILVCLAEPLLQAGVQAVLVNQPDVRLLDGDVHAVRQQADLVIADYATAVSLVRSHGCGAGGAACRSGRPFPPVLVITAQMHTHAVRSALEEGIGGIVLTGSPVDDLLAGVRALAGGVRYLCPLVSRQLYQYTAPELLTSRQDEVLQLLARGLCNKTIARRLEIEVETVKAHVKAILSKLHANCRMQAVSIATERGLLSCQNPRCGA